MAWKYNPIFLLSALGGLVLIPAFGILGWVAYQQFFAGVWHSGWALIGVLMLLFASQAIGVATISALMKRMEQRIAQRLTQKGSA